MLLIKFLASKIRIYAI